MFTQGFAEVLTDVMTTNPSLSAISSASAILDTSNYTFYAASIGKDAQGFKFHAHTVSSYSGGVYNSSFVLAQRRNSIAPSSYHSSATHCYYSSTYSSVPNAPWITDTRLEGFSTSSNVSCIDIGHYTNPVIDSSFSSAWNVIGAYPPSSHTAKYMLVDSNGAFVLSGVLSGILNSLGVVDKYGYINFDRSVFQPGTVPSTAFSAGPFIQMPTLFSATPYMDINLLLKYGDAASIALFGGINHFGLWSINIKELIRNGLNPPYDIKNINISSKYKLVAKITMWKDLLNHIDSSPFSGLKDILAQGTGLTYGGPTYSLRINFK